MAVTLVNTANVTDNGTLELLNGTLTNFGEFNAVTTAAVGGTTYVFGTGFADDGVSVFSLASDGTLTNVAVAGRQCHRHRRRRGALSKWRCHRQHGCDQRHDLSVRWGRGR